MNFAPEWEMLAFGLMTGAITFIGGSVALRFSAAPNLLQGFSSGTMIGVALFDLIPEAVRIADNGNGSLNIWGAVAAGFGLYLAIDWSSVVLVKRRVRRNVAPATLVLHSFLDGLGIGFAFHVSLATGVIVVVGVLVHDLIDGTNTITVALAGGATSSGARLWLAADACAPIVGILLAGATSAQALSLAVILGLCGGFFLYIGLGVLLWRGFARGPQLSTLAATALGLCFIYAVIWVSLGG
jgi:zinc transporter, ZIP family